jgi:chromosome segregation ATPase
MIELIMFFALGFLSASLVALVLLSAVWHRAVRLTTKRIEGAIPVSMAEIQADKDQLRAEFAMSTRRLETSVEHLKLKTTEQFAELGRKNDIIRRLKTETEEKSAQVTALEAQERVLRQKLANTEEELALKSKELHQAESELAKKAAEIVSLVRTLTDKGAESDSRRIEITALENQCASLKDRIAGLEKEVAAAEERAAEERNAADRAARSLVDERGKVETLTSRLNEMQELANAGRAQAETLSKNIVNLEGEARRQAELAAQRETELTARLAQREAELIEARTALEASRNEALALHREIENSSRSYNATVDALKSEKSMNEGAMAQLRQDRDRLQREVESLKQQAESNWANERVEGALLRERINDVAAEVVRLAANLEGKNSQIQKIIDQAPARTNGGQRTPEAAPSESGEMPLSLADRIRALQRTRT